MKRTKEEAKITKDNLMNKALRIFIKKGYSQTSQEDIVNALNLTRGAFYGHFKSKEDLLKQLMTQELKFISALITDSFIDHSDEEVRLQKLLSNVIDNFYNNKRFRDVIELSWFRLEVDLCSYVLKDKTDFNEFFIEETHKVLLQAQKSGKLKKSIKPLETSIHIACMVTGIYRLYFVAPAYLRNKETAHRICSDYIAQLFNQKGLH